jgi:hypothetical protein
MLLAQVLKNRKSSSKKLDLMTTKVIEITGCVSDIESAEDTIATIRTLAVRQRAYAWM